MTPSAPVEAVMFDMDGTLVNSRQAIVSSYYDASEQVLGERRPSDDGELEEILKLRRRTCMVAVCAVVTVGAVAIFYAVLAALHLADARRSPRALMHECCIEIRQETQRGARCLSSARVTSAPMVSCSVSLRENASTTRAIAPTPTMRSLAAYATVAVPLAGIR